MKARTLRHWIMTRRAGEAREWEALRHDPPSQEVAVRGALALIALAGRIFGWPLPEDAVLRRDDQRAYERWVRLRSRWLTHDSTR